jgi:hypothetical protein
MQIPETPQSVTELELMKQLDSYANGNASWNADSSAIGEAAKQACRTLHTNLTNLVNGLLAYILDRVTAREMEMFTMHDRVHGRKVAHLMWHILKPERRERLTPPEIGILLVSAHLHDLGMGLSPAERAARLAPDSDLWDKLEIQDSVKNGIESLRTQIADERTSDSLKRRAEQQLFQAEEALLTQDTRERHATRGRYEEILGLLAHFHQREPTRIPDIEAALSFDGDSFRDKLIDVCTSHNEDSDGLVANDEKNLDRPRFPEDFPVGRCNADLHMVAAALRLADILDFDRERTPAALFHYLLPTTLGGLENRSILEWSKHLAISNWHIERDAIVFRGRSQSHIIHHAVVQFCTAIADEIKATHATFSPLGEEDWPFVLPFSVKADIHEEGYRYVPYKFELDDERVYSLLMGGAIYDNPLVAVRELVQNAVDACKLRDSLTRLYEEYEEPSKVNRIIIRYEEPTSQCSQSRLIVKDTGTGMDAYTLERYFLQVGSSYYNSSDFNQFRVQLRKKNLDFAPVSEFGIGFLSTFLLADYVEVETAMWEPLRGDTAKRVLKIDGPTRLIRLDEQRNDGAGRFKGTRITLFLAPKIAREDKFVPASWGEIKKYLIEICQDLPYILNLEYESNEGETKEIITSSPLTVDVPPHLQSAALHIPVDDKEFGMEGEIVLINPYIAARAEQSLIKRGGILAEHQEDISTGDHSSHIPTRLNSLYLKSSALLRGGFKVSGAFNLPTTENLKATAGARLRFTWNTRTNKRYLAPNLARNNMSNQQQIGSHIQRTWLTYLLQHVEGLPKGQIFNLEHYINEKEVRWLENFNAFTIYRLARQDWVLQLRQKKISDRALKNWEAGKGKPLWYAFNSLGKNLLDLVMPRITKLQIGKDGDDTIVPPPPGWISTLENCQDFMRSPITWGNFVDYDKEINDFLYYEVWGNTERLNSRYKNKFHSWTEKELYNLRKLLSGLLIKKKKVRRLDSSQLALFNRAVEASGDLKVGSLKLFFTLNSLNVTEV